MGTVPCFLTGSSDVRLEELDFAFPEELIAQRPVEPRDSCRLMHLTEDGKVSHRAFTDLPGLLRPGDTVVFNDSRVLPARVQAYKPTGGRVEVLFLRPCAGGGDLWEALARPSHRLKPGCPLVLPGGETITLQPLLGEGRWLVEGPGDVSLVSLMEKHGMLPLPPYIKDYPSDPESYQTVYAARLGSAAAPTAGLHFTPAMLEVLKRRGIDAAYVTLHVGLDTFQPIREEVVEDHRIHRETYSVTAENIALLRATRARGGRLVAVGTTATRVLETLAGIGVFDDPGPGASEGHGVSRDGEVGGDTEIFIVPGYRFKAVDVLLTNFHLPKSSVLALVMAFAGVDRLRTSYEEAIALRYRFFSFGDAMLIEKDAEPRPPTEGRL
jgi:S-adenosylmethionine:tRNA ribosyltransferase-isomerase